MHAKCAIFLVKFALDKRPRGAYKGEVMSESDSARLDGKLPLRFTSAVADKTESIGVLYAKLREISRKRECLVLESARLDAHEDALLAKLKLLEKPIVKVMERPCRICHRFTKERFNDLPQCRRHLDKTTGGDDALNAIVTRMMRNHPKL